MFLNVKLMRGPFEGEGGKDRGGREGGGGSGEVDFGDYI